MIATNPTQSPYASPSHVKTPSHWWQSQVPITLPLVGIPLAVGTGYVAKGGSKLQPLAKDSFTSLSSLPPQSRLTQSSFRHDNGHHVTLINPEGLNQITRFETHTAGGEVLDDALASLRYMCQQYQLPGSLDHHGVVFFDSHTNKTPLVTLQGQAYGRLFSPQAVEQIEAGSPRSVKAFYDDILNEAFPPQNPLPLTRTMTVAQVDQAIASVTNVKPAEHLFNYVSGNPKTNHFAERVIKLMEYEMWERPQRQSLTDVAHQVLVNALPVVFEEGWNPADPSPKEQIKRAESSLIAAAHSIIASSEWQHAEAFDHWYTHLGQSLFR